MQNSAKLMIYFYEAVKKEFFLLKIVKNSNHETRIKHLIVVLSEFRFMLSKFYCEKQATEFLIVY